MFINFKSSEFTSGIIIAKLPNQFYVSTVFIGICHIIFKILLNNQLVSLR